MEKISTRGGVRPAVVASGDMMTLRPVGATIGPADLARRAAPRSGRFADDDKSSPPAGRLARRRTARRKCVAEQNCDFAAAPVRGVQNFNVAASHIAREVTPLRISPEGRVNARLARG